MRRIKRNCTLFIMITDSRILQSFRIHFILFQRTGLALMIRIDEGKQYFLRNVDWVGNSVYRKEDLEKVFNVKKGSVYNQSHLLMTGLMAHRGAQDAVSNLYQDYGYLFSRLTPVEAKVDNDSVDLEVRIL